MAKKIDLQTRKPAEQDDFKIHPSIQEEANSYISGLKEKLGENSPDLSMPTGAMMRHAEKNIETDEQKTGFNWMKKAMSVKPEMTMFTAALDELGYEMGRSGRQEKAERAMNDYKDQVDASVKMEEYRLDKLGELQKKAKKVDDPVTADYMANKDYYDVKYGNSENARKELGVPSSGTQSPSTEQKDHVSNILKGDPSKHAHVSSLLQSKYSDPSKLNQVQNQASVYKNF